MILGGLVFALFLHSQKQGCLFMAAEASAKAAEAPVK
jgi:hypothetical protein